MPEMFTRFNWWRRDLAFRMQVRSGRTLMLSSESARSDLERFYPASRGRGHVVRFAIELDIDAHMKRGEEMRALYGLPERFFFLPNQFWRHKNHAVIVAALARLKAEGKLLDVPPVILSGQSNDVRNPHHFPDLMRAVREAGVESHFRYQGLIPYDHVLNLAARCDALINPSYFEGWSTPIEEAKAVGAPLILSDIPVHKEQAPDARLFNPDSSGAVADALLEFSLRPPRSRAPLEALIAAQERRLENHAGSLLRVVRSAMQTASLPARAVP